MVPHIIRPTIVEVCHYKVKARLSLSKSLPTRIQFVNHESRFVTENCLVPVGYGPNLSSATLVRIGQLCMSVVVAHVSVVVALQILSNKMPEIRSERGF